MCHKALLVYCDISLSFTSYSYHKADKQVQATYADNNQDNHKSVYICIPQTAKSYINICIGKAYKPKKVHHIHIMSCPLSLSIKKAKYKI